MSKIEYITGQFDTGGGGSVIWLVNGMVCAFIRPKASSRP